MDFSHNKLSVLITYFNEKELLKECIDSLLSSGNKPFEILIYDDKSSFPAIQYIPKEPIIKVITAKENRGPGFGRTTLLNSAKGNYIHFHDADDLFHPDWLKYIVQTIERSSPDLILTGIESRIGKEIKSSDVMGLNKMDLTDINLTKLGLSGSILVPSTTFRKKLGLLVGGYLPREILPQSEDFHFHIALAKEINTVEVINKPLIYQRIRPNSHSNKAGQLVCYTSALKALNLLEDDLKIEYKYELAQSYSRIGYNLFVNGDKKNARIAFSKAKKYGISTFENRSKIFNLIAKNFNQELAERISLNVQHAKKFVFK
ncbi:MAG: glycosyltransferase family 2 protein [Bacteroidota bacterium]